MNKISHRYEPNYHVSKIQASLKEMKEEVDGYLKKNNKEIVPPILRGRHYLLIDTINHLGSTKPIESPKKLLKDLSSQALNPYSEGTRFEPLRSLDHEERKKNRVVKKKRGISFTGTFNKGQQPETNCVLPNICNIKLDYDDQLFTNNPIKKLIQEERRSSRVEIRQSQKETSKNFKRYQSIDLSQSTHFAEDKQDGSKSILKGSKRIKHQLMNKKIPQKGFKFQPESQSKAIIVLEETLTPTFGQSQDEAFTQQFQMKQIAVFDESHVLSRKRTYQKMVDESSKSKYSPRTQNYNYSAAYNLKKDKSQQKNPEQQLTRFEPWQDGSSKSNQDQIIFDRSII